MRRFKFLTDKYEFNGITFRDEIIESTLEFCQIYKDYIEQCRLNYLHDHPWITEDDHYSYPIPNNPIERDFHDGKLWHGGSDYDDNKLTHYVYFDTDNDINYYIYVEETEDGNFIIENFERETNEDRFMFD